MNAYPAYCKYCGGALKGQDKFCGYCGRPIGNIEKTDLEQKNSNPSVTQIQRLANQTADAVRRFQESGKEDVFDEIYRLTYAFVFYTVKKYRVPESAVEDVIQDSFVSVFKGIGRVDNPQAALAWIKKIAFHKSMDYFRKNDVKKEETYEDNCRIETAYSEEEAEDTHFPIPEDFFDKLESQKLLKKCLENLPEESKMVLLAFYFNECKISEIAQSLNLPEGTVKTRLHRARQQLKVNVEQMEKTQGVRIHSVAIAPLLLFLFQTDASSQQVQAAEMEQGLRGLHSKLTQTGSNNVAEVTARSAFAIKATSIAMTAVIAGAAAGGYFYLNRSTPERTIAQFETAWNARDTDAMVACLDQKTQQSYQTVKSVTSLFGADPQDLLDGIFDFSTSVGLAEESDFLADIKVDSVKMISSDQAQAYVEVNLGKQDYKDLMNLVKEDGTWHILTDGK